MRRRRLIELHEQPWLPSFLRDEVTDALHFGLNLLGAYAPIAPLLQKALDSTGSRSIVDMCSGGGGPWPELYREMPRVERSLHIWLTDKYPSGRASENVNSGSENHVRFYPNPVDAMSVPRELSGFRTIFTSFHHFSPDEARAVLQDAVDARQGIGVFEITKRAPTAIGMMFLWSLLMFVCTPAIRPFRWSRLFWTYLIPVIPFVLLFDGVVSCLRTYQPQELRSIIEELNAKEYQWEAGEHSRALGCLALTYSIGYPKASTSPASS